MKYLLLSFDIEELNKDTEMSKEGLVSIIKLLKQHNLVCTFFITHYFADRHQELIDQLINDGHEIALHALNHDDNYKKMPSNGAFKRLKIAKEDLEKKFNIKINGFRAPNMYHPDYSVLKNLNLTYDSSFHPTYIPGHYNNFFRTRKPFKKNNLIVIPISVTPIFRAPFSWFWFRLFGLNYAKICTKLSLIDSDYILLYFHPWEFSDRLKEKRRFCRNSGKRLLNMLDRYIQWCIKQDLKPTTIINYLENDTISKTLSG